MTRERDNPLDPGADAAGAPAPRRLIEDSGADAAPASKFAVDLLRAATPYQAPPGRKQRVKLGLGHPTATAHRAPMALRVALVVGVLIGLGTVASAALERWPGFLTEAYRRLVPARAPATAPPRAAGPRRVVAPAVTAVAEPEMPAAPVAAEALPAETATAAARPTPALVPRAPRAAAAGTRPASEDTSPVVEAMRALRVERNPKRARALLARYLEQHPGGALAEEALAITIEAAVAHRDADAAALAARYLRLYPDGHFLALARKAAAVSGAAPQK